MYEKLVIEVQDPNTDEPIFQKAKTKLYIKAV